MTYTLQFIHDTPTGGQNVIEVDFDQRHKIDAALRRHRKNAIPLAPERGCGAVPRYGHMTPAGPTICEAYTLESA